MMNVCARFPCMERPTMAAIPVITTERLALRPFLESDAPAVARILSDPRMFEHTLRFATPYPVETAVRWIASHAEDAARGVKLQWAIALPDDTLIGTVSLAVEEEPPRGDLGYWIGMDFRDRGYATEAVRAVVAWGFDALHLPRIEAMCFATNAASIRVLRKSGLALEPVRPRYIVDGGQEHDVHLYAVTRWPEGSADDHHSEIGPPSAP
jgi:ribosomal-protein-alanine N-acetyltransferase